MALILTINTALENASVQLGAAIRTNSSQKDHASWIHVAIRDVLEESKLNIEQVQAIAVVAGPGSYTGLRVGMATAKGLCYAASLPLITLNTLEVMAAEALGHLEQNSAHHNNSFLLVPMIDARRMEVFTAVYDKNLHPLMAPTAVVLEPSSFGEFLSRDMALFFGSGSLKFKQMYLGANAEFVEIPASAAQVEQVVQKKFRDREFADVAYSEPVYLKEFYTHPSR